jgi:hypothetical protein
LGNIEKAQILLDHSVVLFYLLTRECEGKSFPPWQAAPIEAKAAKAPVYACLDFYLDSGIIGRRLTSNSFNRAY